MLVRDLTSHFITYQRIPLKLIVKFLKLAQLGFETGSSSAEFSVTVLLGKTLFLWSSPLLDIEVAGNRLWRLCCRLGSVGSALMPMMQ